MSLDGFSIVLDANCPVVRLGCSIAGTFGRTTPLMIQAAWKRLKGVSIGDASGSSSGLLIDHGILDRVILDVVTSGRVFAVVRIQSRS